MLLSCRNRRLTSVNAIHHENIHFRYSNNYLYTVSVSGTAFLQFHKKDFSDNCLRKTADVVSLAAGFVDPLFLPGCLTSGLGSSQKTGGGVRKRVVSGVFTRRIFSRVDAFDNFCVQIFYPL